MALLGINSASRRCADDKNTGSGGLASPLARGDAASFNELGETMKPYSNEQQRKLEELQRNIQRVKKYHSKMRHYNRLLELVKKRAIH